jgi:hypothetical protein
MTRPHLVREDRGQHRRLTGHAFDHVSHTARDNVLKDDVGPRSPIQNSAAVDMQDLRVDTGRVVR